ncbi:MAG: type II secretion system protein GspG [Opitutaceae bacterium]|nr:type II secretion system protein GspG [Opitutaceae bacterium]
MKLRSEARDKRGAFTLIELLAVLALLGLLAGLVATGVAQAVERARSDRAEAELAVLAAALEEYRRAFGDYPRTDSGAGLLAALLGKKDPGMAPIEARPLLDISRFTVVGGEGDSRLLDPWGLPYAYAYRVPDSGWVNPLYVLCSRGPDGAMAPGLVAGGFPERRAGENADNRYAEP